MRAHALILMTTGLLSAGSQASETITYTYDTRGRLVQVCRNGSVNDGIVTGYAYDKADNRTTVTTANGGSCGGGGGGSPPSFTISNASVTEGGTLAFTVTKTGTTSSSFSVDYATASGTATSGTDFTPAGGTLIFTASETSKPVNVTTTQDSTFEPNETVLVNLSNATGGTTITDAQGVGTIVNDDSSNQPPIAVNDSLNVPACGTATKNVIANDSDPDNNLPLTLVSVSSASQGTATVISSTTVRYNSDTTSGETLTYTVRDSLGATDTGNLFIGIAGGFCQ